MKLSEYSGSDTITNMTSVDMGISDDPVDQLLILNVLSNTLYTDKVTAVWREYGCNAYDANVEAGRGDMPIEITLPSKMCPEAKIRDFGFGMTEQQILQVFCKLGRSTKRGSNELVGMLGIGSKAGFAYGDNFTVTSWAQGTKAIYTCFRDKGVPRLSKMHEEPTNSPEGVEVKVPVRLDDIGDFLVKAERVFRYFKVRPIIHGGTLDFKVRGVPAFSGHGWRYIGDGSDSYAVMGNIGYKIDDHALPATFGSNRKTLLELGVELDFEIGELEISANREGLQMKDQTLKAIGARVDTLSTEIATVFTNLVKNAKCMWEAKLLYSQSFENQTAGYYGRTLRDVVGTKIVWNGQVLKDSHLSVENKEKDPEVQVTGYTRRYGRSKCSLVSDPDHVKVCDKTTLVLNDLPNGKLAPGRVREWFVQHAGVDTLIVFTFATKTAQPRFFGRRSLTGAPLTLMSTMPKPPRIVGVTGAGAQVSAHRAKHSAQAFTLKAPSTQYYSADSQYWDLAVADLDSQGPVWVGVEKFLAQGPGLRAVSPARLQEQVTLMRKAGLLKGPLYGFKPAKLDKVKAAAGWTQLAAHVQAHVDKILQDATAKQELADYIYAVAYTKMMDDRHRNLFPVGSLLREYLDEVYRMRNPATNVALWAFLDKGTAEPWAKLPANLPKSTTDLKKFDARLLVKYPMLKEWSQFHLRSHMASDIAPVIDYVKLVEDN